MLVDGFGAEVDGPAIAEANDQALLIASYH